MSVVDKLDAARHSITGSNLAKIACKATSREVMGPKRKHVDYLIQCTNTDNVSIPNLAEILFERCTNSSWVVVFKSLCTFHHLMSYGNERFIQYMASRTTSFTLQGFLDKSGVQGYDMSTFVRRYANYLNEKAWSYREMGYDFCRCKRGKEDGVLRAMDSTKLLKALPVLQKQTDALLEVDIKSTELSNGVINCAFVLLFKDLIRLFACYNDGVINLLEKYFDMPKKECKAALDIYKRFVTRMDRVSEFMKTAEDVGFDKEDIPDLSKAPNSLLDALENHYQALEKGKATTASHKPLTIPSITVPKVAIDAFESGSFLTKFDDTDTDVNTKHLLEEEEKHLQAFKSAKESNTSVQLPKPQASQPSQVPRPQVPQAPQQLPWQASAPAPAKATSPSDDLLQLDAAFAVSIPQATSTSFSPSSAFQPSQPFSGGQQAFPSSGGFGSTSQWGATNAPPHGFDSNRNPFGEPTQSDADFDQVFGGKAVVAAPSDVGVLQPVAASNAAPNLISQRQAEEESIKGTGDLHSSLQRVAKSLDSFSVGNGSVKSATGKTQHQWTPSQPQVKTGGPNWQKQNLMASTTLPPSQPAWGGAAPVPGAQPVPPMAQPMGGMYRPGFTPVSQPMGQGMFPPSGGFGTQPFQRASPQPQMPSDPFGPIPGSQARF